MHVVFLSAVVPPDGTKRSERRGRASHAVQSSWTVDQVIDDSGALLTETVDLTGLQTDVPRTYVRLTNDVCYPPELQENSARIVCAETVPGDIVFMDSGHMAMVTIPDQVAALLNSQ